MPKKIRELKKLLTQAGFKQIPKRGKGSHTMWAHPLYNGRITLSGQAQTRQSVARRDLPPSEAATDKIPNATKKKM